MQLLTAIFDSIVRTSFAWLMLFIAISSIELFTARSRPNILGWMKSLSYWALWIPATAIVESTLIMAWAAIGIEPFIVLDPTDGLSGLLAIIVAIGATILYHDFAFYWFHRAQHRWFWRWHAVHHSIRDLNGINSYHHISEGFFRSIIIMIPASLLVLNVHSAFPVLVLIMWLQSLFLHSTTTIDIGPLRKIFGDNRFHRIHHSLEPRHFDRNFGAHTTIWDRLFGTAYWPSKEEWPDTGIAEIDEPATVGEWLSLPWRFQSDQSVSTAIEPDYADSLAIR